MRGGRGSSDIQRSSDYTHRRAVVYTHSDLLCAISKGCTTYYTWQKDRFMHQ